MKRVQALVNGRKKQCTKLPKPTVKEKTSPDVNSAGHSRKLPENKAKGKDSAGSSKLAVSSAVIASSTSSTITAESNNTADITSVTSSKAESKIPGTSPKKSGRDGGGWMLSRKGHQSQEKSRVSKSESFSKKFTKEKKSDRVNESTAEAVTREDSVSMSGKKMESQCDVGYVTENRYVDPSQEMETADQIVKSKPVSSPHEKACTTVTSSETPKSVEKSVLNDARLQDATVSGSRRQSDQNTITSQQTQNPDNQRTDLQPQNNQPRHGILKDSSSNNESSNSINRANHQNGSELLINASNSETREHSSRGNNQPSRAASFRENTSQFYQQPYGSLPRKSRSTTPTPEAAYSYGSFPRRTHLSNLKQQDVMFNGSQEWNSLSRKAESDFVYPMGQFDSDRSNSRSRINHLGTNISKSSYGITGYSNDNYGIVGPSYHMQRSSTLSNDLRVSGYRISRNGIGTSNYCSDTETVMYRDVEGYNRGVRGGSVPLGYESDSGAYGVVVHGQPRFGSMPRSYEAAADFGSGGSLRVHPDDEQYRAGPGKRPIPRRHTVGTSSNRIDTKNTVSCCCVSIGLR